MHRPLSKWGHLLNAVTLPAILAINAIAGAADTPRAEPFTFHDPNILGTSLDLQVNTPSAADAEKAHAAVLAEVERLRKILSTYDPATDISRINASTAPVKVAQELIDVLKLYDVWQAKSRNTYSAGLGDAIALWKKAETDGKAPDPATLSALASKLQKPLWKIDDDAKTVQRTSDVTINLDSLGKGYIANQAAIVARQKVSSVRGMLVNIGGDIIALGASNSSGAFTPWTVGVADPASPADNAPPLVQLHLTATTVATSGNYARGFKLGEKTYSHILDPRTCLPVDFNQAKDAATVKSATVIAADNAVANALATALCVMTPSEGLALIRSIPEAQCLIVLSDGTQDRSPGFKRFEAPAPVVAKPAEPATVPAGDKPAAPVVAGGSFPKGYEVSVALQLLPPGQRARSPKAYLAVWIENDQGAYVKTLALWGNEQKYIKSLKDWSKQAQKDPQLMASATRPTRPAGKYSFTWDGTDEKGKPVPRGSYKVCVNSAYWAGGQSQSSGTITCGDQKATGTVPKANLFDDVALTYAPKGS